MISQFALNFLSFLVEIYLGKEKQTKLKIICPNPTHQAQIKTQYNFETYYGYTTIKNF
jgi:hypothetical protein